MRLPSPAFQFRLWDDHSIGHEALRRMWAAACSDDAVRVARKWVGTSTTGASKYLYCLYPPASGFNAAVAESRMTLSLRTRYPAVVLQRL